MARSSTPSPVQSPTFDHPVMSSKSEKSISASKSVDRSKLPSARKLVESEMFHS